MTPGQAAVATNCHYDLPPQIFESFLDSRMKYTCGLYLTGRESLDEAQLAKLKFIARVLHVRAGQRVLDVGCGWGSLLLFLAQEFGCQVAGITPSSIQVAYARDRVAAAGVGHLATVDVASIYDAGLAERKLDAVTLVGVAEALPDLPAVLRRVSGWLRLGGRLYLSASCYRSGAVAREFADRPASRQVSDHIFGFGTMRPLSELLDAIGAAGLSPSGVYDLSAHYRRTIVDWQTRIAANRKAIDALRPGYADELLAYFDTANAGWGYTTKHYAITAVRARRGETELVE